MKRAFVVVLGTLAGLLAGACGEDAAPPAAPTQAPVCVSDDECAPGSCDPFRGCVDCRTTAQCTSGERCLGGSCQEPKSCETDAECSESGQRCDAGTATCVECTAAEHCEPGAACVGGACQPASFCDDAAGCRLGTVCDLEHGRCVECLGNLDCGAGGRCIDQRCTTSCEQNVECGAGLVCDQLLHICAECVTTDDCAASEHCSQGRCVLDACVPGSGTCQGSQGIVLCGSAGDRATPLYCGKHAACVGEPGEASCTDWVCKPGFTTCNADERHLETCSLDGLSVMASVDCNETNQACVGSVCVDIVCEPGETKCEAGSNSLHSCSSNGTVETVTPCTATQYCDPDSPACLEKICAPDAVTCVGEQVGTCDELGGDYASLEDCETDETCVNGSCTPIVCDPLDQLCGDDGNAYACSESGTALTLLATCEQPGENTGGEASIGYGQHCQDHGAQAGCYDDPCVKGQPYCSDNHVATCNPEGTGPVGDGLDCGTDAVCVTSGGPHCAPKVCTPSTKFCDPGSGDVYNCSTDGTLSYLWDDCSAAEYCDAAAGTCKTKLCTPDVAGCNGSVAATCNADGSGWLAGGTDCSATGDACDGGVCKDVVCTPQGYLCKSGNVHRCNALGTGDALYQTCSTDQHCLSGNQYCSYDICPQSQPGCNGTVATTCNADGSAWSAGGTDCSLTDEICDTGTCKAEICSPYAFSCVGGNVERCNALGTATALYDTCASNEHCQQGSSACQPDKCTNGVKLCADGIPTTCAPDGSGPVPGGTPCTADKVCLSGNCQLKICEPGEYFCKDGHVNLCVAGGTAGNPYRQCLADEYCDDTTVSCAKRACTGTTKGCQGESYGVCNSEGSAFDAAPVVDCLASGNLCTRTGCATSALDVLGGTDGSYKPELTHVYGNIIYTTASRKLTKLELSARTTAVGSTIHWIIYRSDTVNGTYTPVYDITAPGAAAGFQPVDVSFTVDANAFYYIAVLFKGPQPTTTLRQGTVIGGAISFARPVSSMFHWTDGDRDPPASFTGPTWHYQTLPLYMRITSVLP